MFLFIMFYDYINLSILFFVSFYNFLLINLHVFFHVFFHVFIYDFIYDFLLMLFHHVFEQMHWENLYYLLCAFSLYFSMNALRKSLSFTMCFFTLFLDERTEKISIIYYVLLHSISRWTHWENFYHLLCAFSFYFSTNILRKLLSFTMCFLIEFILFFDERIVIEKLFIILYMLSHHVLRRAHCHWENLYYLVSAFSVIDVRDLTSILIVIDVKSFLETLRKSLLFSRCFLIIFLDERIEKTSII